MKVPVNPNSDQEEIKRLLELHSKPSATGRSQKPDSLSKRMDLAPGVITDRGSTPGPLKPIKKEQHPK